jgi:hypothetical protein
MIGNPETEAFCTDPVTGRPMKCRESESGYEYQDPRTGAWVDCPLQGM